MTKISAANRLNKDTWSEVLSFIDPLLISTRFRVAQTNKEMYYSLQGSFTGQKIDFCGATDGVMKYFGNVDNIVVMGGGNITDAGLTHLKNVKSIELRGSKITDNGLALLPNVEELYLKATDGITDAGLAHLKNVKKIDLRMCDGITDAGLELLTNLDEIWLDLCEKVTEAGKNKLRDKGIEVHPPPGCR